jgi:hypothetical protein
MQLIQPSHVARPARGPLLMGTVVGGVLLAGGIVLAWLAFATPLVRVLTPSVVRPSFEQIAFGWLIWGISLVAPPCFAIVGFIRLWQVAGCILRKPAVGPIVRAPASCDRRLPRRAVTDAAGWPGGSGMSSSGRSGSRVIGEAPPEGRDSPPRVAWEVPSRPTAGGSRSRRRLDRTARDAERVRR